MKRINEDDFKISGIYMHPIRNGKVLAIKIDDSADFLPPEDKLWLLKSTREKFQAELKQLNH